MINVEKEIFTTVSTRIRSLYPDIYITGEYVKSPPSFPAISLIEADNSMYSYTQTSDEYENHSTLLYDVDIYSNKVKGKKTECRALAALVDKEMVSLGFTRIMLQPIPNMDDATIYRIKGRYRAVVSKDKNVYRR
jgi:hypothetical protein